MLAERVLYKLINKEFKLFINLKEVFYSLIFLCYFDASR